MGLGADAKDITEASDYTFKQYSALFQQLRFEVGDNWIERKKTMIFVYYSGHAQTNGKLREAVLNEKRRFPLERSLNYLSKTRGAFVISLLDCSSCESIGEEGLFEQLNQPAKYQNCVITKSLG